MDTGEFRSRTAGTCCIGTTNLALKTCNLAQFLGIEKMLRDPDEAFVGIHLHLRAAHLACVSQPVQRILTQTVLRARSCPADAISRVGIVIVAIIDFLFSFRQLVSAF